MRQATTLVSIRTERQGLLEITDRIVKWSDAQAVKCGLLTIFCRHTSASLLIQENAAAAVRSDLERYFARIAQRIRQPIHMMTRGRMTCQLIYVRHSRRCSLPFH